MLNEDPELKELDEAYAQVGIVSTGAPFIYTEIGRHEFIFGYKGEKYKLKLTKIKPKNETVRNSIKNKSTKKSI